MVSVRKNLSLAIILTGAVLTAAPVWACPVLLKASPKVGANVTGTVDKVTLYFSGPIDVAHSDLGVFDSANVNIAVGKPQGVGDPVKAISVPIRSVSKGVYKVKWHIHCDCEDAKGAIFPGDYSFIVQ